MFIIKYKKVFVIISLVLMGLSILSISYFGLNFGIDFKGGAQMEVVYTGDRPESIEVEQAVEKLSLGTALVQPTGTDGYSIKTRDLSEAERSALIESLGDNVIEKSFTSIGPSVGKELARKSIVSFILVAFGIIVFIAFSFRKVSKPVSSWKYGLIAILSLVHDVIIPTGIFAIISHVLGAEVDTLFIVAILTILGLSVSDTIVVFDRIRENLRTFPGKTFEENVGSSINQVYTRSLMTSLTTIVVLLCIFFFGPKSTKIFALMLTAGMFFGTYSSIFLASPMLIFVKNWQKDAK